LLITITFLSGIAVAQPLTAIGDNVTVCQPGPQVIDVQANDQAAGGGPYVGNTYLFSTTTPKGSISLINADSILYTPNPGELGQDNFQYFIGDTALGNISIGNVVITLIARPGATDEQAITLSGQGLTIDVQSNDTANNGSLSTFINFAPANGTATVLNMDSILFNPDPGFVGQAIISYRVCNTCGCDSAQAIVSVERPCQTPESNDDIADVNEGEIRYIDVLSNDQIGGQNPNSLSIINGPLNGTAAIAGNLTIRYRSNPGFSGLDSIQYRLSTACGSDSAWLQILVSDSLCSRPMAMRDVVSTPWSDTCGGSYAVLQNDIDPAEQGGTITIVSVPSLGTATVNGNKITYTPSGNPADSLSTDSLAYSFCNVCGCDTAWLSIQYTAQSCNATAPTAGNDYYDICSGDTIILNLLDNDIDADGDQLFIDAIQNQPPSGAGIVSILNDTQAIIISDPNFSGSDYFYYQITDNGNPANTAIALVELELAPCIGAPQFQYPKGVNRDVLDVTLLEDQDSLICFDLPDPDADPVQIVSANGAFPGTLTILQDTCILLEPATDSSGSGSFVLIACDDRQPLCDTLILNVTVVPVNDAPVAVNDTFIYNWSGTLTMNVLANDSDPEGETISLTQILDPPFLGIAMQNSAGNIEYDADSSSAGIDSLSYVICDSTGACDTAWVFILVPVHAVDDIVIADYETPITFNVTDNDVTGPQTTVGILTQPFDGTLQLNPDGSITYSPFAGFQGNDQFTYYICEQKDTILGCDTATVFITVSQPPTAVIVPEGFSPNGDGINDFLVIDNISFFPDATLIVFNRWGNEVWRSENGYNNDFDGRTRDGDNLPDGSYYFVLELNDPAFPNPGGYLMINR
jgi:gliding motility-associated-like protein